MTTDRQSGQLPTEPRGGTPAAEFNGSVNGSTGHLIRIGEKKERVKAIRAFRRVRLPYIRFPGHVMGLMDEHIRALKMDKVSFEYISKAPHGET
jgi:hypothetical protein